MLSMIENPMPWYSQTFDIFKKGNDSLRKVIGIEKEQKVCHTFRFFQS